MMQTVRIIETTDPIAPGFEVYSGNLLVRIAVTLDEAFRVAVAQMRDIPSPRRGWSAPADDWCRETAARMFAENYAPGAIVAYLEAYGCGLYAAQALVRDLRQGVAA